MTQTRGTISARDAADDVTGDGFPVEFSRDGGRTSPDAGARGGLTAREIRELQGVADRTGLPFSVVGERGGHRGRNVDTNLPFGDGAERRSPIELAFPAEYDLLTGGVFTEELYKSLDRVLGRRSEDRLAYWQASHLWPVPGESIDFYPRTHPQVSAPLRSAGRSVGREAGAGLNGRPNKGGSHPGGARTGGRASEPRTSGPAGAW